MLFAVGFAVTWWAASVCEQASCDLSAAVLRHPSLPASRSAPAQLHRGALARVAGLLLLSSAGGEPALALTDGPLGVLGGIVGADSGEFAPFSREVYGANDNRVKIRFDTCWPVRLETDGGIRVGFEARKDNRFPGEVGFVQVVKRIGAAKVEGLTLLEVVDAVFSNQENAAPESVKIAGKPKTIKGPGGETYKVISVRFTRVGNSGMEIESHALLSATVVEGDLITFVVTCRESTWPKSKERFAYAVDSFQATPAKY